MVTSARKSPGALVVRQRLTAGMLTVQTQFRPSDGHASGPASDAGFGQRE